MRKGQNPAKFLKAVPRPERITVALLSYIPFLSGFYAETLDVLKACLQSARDDAGLPFDLMVFDNGSCPEARDFLIAEKDGGRIQYLILSEKNVGKGGAWNIMLPAAPGAIIAYTDSDVLFSPGWLKRSVEILETFPNVGMVTARPFRTPPEFYSRTLEWARQAGVLDDSQEQFIPWETFLEFNLSLGQTEEENRKVYAETRDWVMNCNGVTALAGASHWQFTAYKSTLEQFLPFDMEKPMGQVRQLDQRMNDAGLLRLMVSDPLAMNMSNTLGYVRGELKGHARPTPASFTRRLLELGPIKKTLLALYNRIFRWYYS
jgi:glycosyltransferase involved in cell wall biosynthesis